MVHNMLSGSILCRQGTYYALRRGLYRTALSMFEKKTLSKNPLGANDIGSWYVSFGDVAFVCGGCARFLFCYMYEG